MILTLEPMTVDTGHRPDSWYVDRFWTPVLGPTGPAVGRRLVEQVDGGDRLVDVNRLAWEVGLGGNRHRSQAEAMLHVLRRLSHHGCGWLDQSSGTFHVAAEWPHLSNAKLHRYVPPNLWELHAEQPDPARTVIILP